MSEKRKKGEKTQGVRKKSGMDGGGRRIEGKLNGVFIDVTFYWKNKRKSRGRKTLFGRIHLYQSSR
jgi:hypothetical protein